MKISLSEVGEVGMIVIRQFDRFNFREMREQKIYWVFKTYNPFELENIPIK